MDSNFNSLQASFWFMLLLQTMGSVDMPGRGARKMPAPRAYLAVIVAWSVLQLLADAGMDRAAKTVGWALVVTGMVLGPFGKRLTELFGAIVPPAPQASPPPPIAATPFHLNG